MRCPAASRYLISFLALASWLAWVQPTRAGVDRWSAVAPPGGQVTALALDAGLPSFLYAGTSLGLYRGQVDSATQWVRLAGGLPQGGVHSLAVEPDGGRRILVQVTGLGGNQLFLSDDRGRSWSRQLSGAFSFDALLATGGPSPAFFAAGWRTGEGVGVFRSLDGGASWLKVLTTATNLEGQALASHPGEPRTVYFTSGHEVMKSLDGGASWFAIERVVGEAEPLVDMTELAIAPSAPGVLYVHGRGGLFRSDDAGASWHRRAAVPAGCETGHLAVRPRDPDAVFLGCVQGVFLSHDGGGSWQASSQGLGLGAPGAALASIRLLIHPTVGRLMWAGTPRRGVYLSATAGRRWAADNAGLRASFVQAFAADPADPARLYAATAGSPQGDSCSSLWRSTDAGHSWQPWASSLGCVVVSCLAVAPTAPRVLYAGAVGGLFRSADDGVSWRSLTTTPVSEIALDPSDSDHLLIAGPGVSLSRDGGRSWRVTLPRSVDGGPFSVHQRVYQLVSEPGRGEVVYALQRVSSAGFLYFTVYRSGDGGASWEEVYLPGSNLQILPGSPATLYSRCGGNWQSTDGGASWQEAPVPGELLLAVASEPPALYAQDGAQLLRSRDGGTTWRSFALTPAAVLPEAPSCESDFVGRWWAHPLAPERLVAWPSSGLLSGQFVGAPALQLLGGRLTVRGVLRNTQAQLVVPAPRQLSDVAIAYEPASVVDPRLVLKVVDGRPANGHLWLFAARLTGWEHELTVEDVESGGVVDLTARHGPPTSMVDATSLPPLPEAAPVLAQATAESGDSVLPLWGGRLLASVTWAHPGDGAGTATAVAVGDRGGYFWFRQPGSPEVAVRIVDGWAVNQRLWVFVGGLTSAAYSLTVLDTQEGAVWTYEHPQGAVASFVDIEALPR